MDKDTVVAVVVTVVDRGEEEEDKERRIDVMVDEEGGGWWIIVLFTTRLTLVEIAGENDTFLLYTRVEREARFPLDKLANIMLANAIYIFMGSCGNGYAQDSPASGSYFCTCSSRASIPQINIVS